MLESVLMRAFLMLYATKFDDEDDRRPCRTSTAEQLAFARLASVCSYWHQTLNGWPQSPTRHWVRHHLKKLIERKYSVM